MGADSRQEGRTAVAGDGERFGINFTADTLYKPRFPYRGISPRHGTVSDRPKITFAILIAFPIELPSQHGKLDTNYRPGV